MKIFEWVHRKFRQTNGQGVKASCEGHRMSEEDFTGYGRNERGYEDEEERNDLTGLLAIGTLGLQQLPEPPLEEKEEEKEKEDEDEDDEEARLQLLYKQLEEAFGLPSNECSNPMPEKEKQKVYPLHEFLHSPLADPSRASNPTKNSKELRTSLGDLFSKSTQKSSPPPDVSHFQHTAQILPQNPKDAAKPGSLSFVKKLLKRKTGNNSGQGIDSGHKLVKVIGLFQRKIHPEEMAASCVNAARSRISSSKHNKSLFRLANCIIPCQRSNMQETVDSECHDPDLVKSSQLCAKEHWIKTDAEYVVLEL